MSTSTITTAGEPANAVPGGLLAERHLDLEPLGLEEVLLEFGGVGIGLGEQDQQPGRGWAPATASGSPVSVRSASSRCASAALAPSLICARTNFSCSTWWRLNSR